VPTVALRDGRLTLPDELREAYHIGEDDHVEAEPVDGGILLRPSPEARRRAALARIRRAQASVRMAPELEALPPEEREARIVEWLEEDERGEHAA
jgi:bifunctional DNA-binding transcriptional regulator/antitoxin component of YhaV-PrlF toxin-antitoxin module